MCLGFGGQVLSSKYLLLQIGNRLRGGRHSLQYTSSPSRFALTDILYQNDAITELSSAADQKSVAMASQVTNTSDLEEEACSKGS